MAPAQGERLPEQLGRYQIIQRLGQGGMGSVYLAEDTQLGRRVALKVSDLRNSPEGLKRFEREARALAALDHPYICHVYDFGNHDGIPFLVMAHIAGASLAESLPEAGLPPRQAAALVGKLAVAMQEAHARGILHRDLKPSNVMMKPTSTGPVPIIVDFGLARGSGSAVEALTGTGQAIGTLPYMPLEQINGDKSIGPACDIYALGVILYELLTGENPFDGPFSSIIAQKLTGTPPPPSALRPGVDPRLEAICLKAMAREVKDRHASTAALAAALTEFLKPKPAPTIAAPALETTLLPVRPLTEDERPDPLIPPPRRPEPPKPPSLRPVPPPLPIPHASRSSGPPPRTPLIVLGALFGGLILLGIIIYVTTDKGEVQDDKKVAGVTYQPKPPEPSPPPPKAVAPATEPDPSEAAPPATEPEKPGVEHSTPPKAVTPSPPTPATPDTEGTTAGAERDDNALKLKLCWCPPGSFRMGSPTDEPERQDGEGPVNVTLSRGFWMGKFEVTQSQWRTVMGTAVAEQMEKSAYKSQGLRGEGPDHPMYYVNHTEAEEFCRKFTESERRAGRLPPGWEYRLPTEAQWEYACRAGTTSATAFGDKLSSVDANFDGTSPYNGAAKGPYLEKTAPVGQYRPNKWGLYDMHGNVWEWCRDGYAEKLAGGIDPSGPSGASSRVIRGGGWDCLGRICRSASRYEFAPGFRCSFLGFRVARVSSQLGFQ